MNLIVECISVNKIVIENLKKKMSATYRFDGKRILVTGAGKGLGRELTKRLHSLGATVIALTRTQSDLDSLKAELPGLITVLCDVADWKKTRKAVESVLPVHHLVNNAAVGNVTPFLEITEEELHGVFGININAVVNVSQVVANDMIKRNEGGCIVNVSSIASRIYLQNVTTYCTSKAALNMITKSMGYELAPYNIRVNAILPTKFPTALSAKVFKDPEYDAHFLGRHPLGIYPDGKPMVDGILHLLSDHSTMMIGSEMVVDGGILSH